MLAMQEGLIRELSAYGIASKGRLSARLQKLQHTGAHLNSGQGELNLLTSIQSKGSWSASIAGGAKKASR